MFKLCAGLAVATLALQGARAQTALARTPPRPLLRETVQVPVHNSNAREPHFRQNIDVEIVRGRTRRRRPFLILLHGRAADAPERARLSLPVYPANSAYFARLGFIVLTPLRVGYGLSGGPDVEYTGRCASKHFAAGVAPAADEVRQVIRFAAARPDVDGAHGILVGESFGGLVALAVAAADAPGIVGVVNISGGDGGDSLHRPDDPCRPDRLRQTFARYGGTSRVPTLWMYSANDRLWGPRLPRQWYRAFVAAGGAGQFVELPADKNNGHFIFDRNAKDWHPAFRRFLASLRSRM